MFDGDIGLFVISSKTDVTWVIVNFRHDNYSPRGLGPHSFMINNSLDKWFIKN